MSVVNRFFTRVYPSILLLIAFGLIGMGSPDTLRAASDPFPRESSSPALSDILESPVHTYYCATNGSNTTGDGSIGNPWYDLIGASSGGNGSAVQAGDVIYFRGGTYKGYSYTNFSYSQNRLMSSGTSSKPIVITNYPGERVVYNYTAHWCLTLDGNNQVLLGTKVGSQYGFQITGGITIRANNCRVSGVEFIGGASNGGDLNPAMLSVPLNQGCDNLLISHNMFRDSKHQSSANRMAGIRFFTTSNSVIEYNIFKDNRELSDCACIYYKDRTTNATVRYNKFINSIDGIEYFTQGDQHNGLSVYENLFYQVDNSINFRNEAGPNIKVYNNVALAIPSSGAFFYYLNADSGSYSDRGEFYNNVIDGLAFKKGWHTNSSKTNNLPNLFDYNLWYSQNDQNVPSGWTIPASYHKNAVIGPNAVSYDSSAMQAVVQNDYEGRSTGRNGTCIGGFTWGTAGSSSGDSSSQQAEARPAAPVLRIVESGS